ncbi:ATP-binding cassette domain-containing protein [Nocardiopsis suaedae]|uniref:ATP-binding cassette domain-containing protein n=1 Tax=Nocardiopsis suaedae TaxID=3018444 RepID=A0ABT4TG37_9ACTN|nr:ATP-binding cassette domain-containing protein [Nocardiopsis suaedae]MDA2803679.1 ATP-binding cassette domain-containing protein [Nocardiopsis suaedae]
MIHARKLSRTFTRKRGKERVEAVRGLDLDVEAGTLLAFLGPNGAGKSTTLRMLTTLLPPTSGSATVAGGDIAGDPSAVRRRIGYVSQKNAASDHHRVRDELVAQGKAYGMTRARAKERADELLDRLELRELADRTPTTLSGGQRRRVDIALGLVHAPELLFLDEPSTGLDPHSRAEVWEFILRLREESGMTLFLTTHYLEEADTMAERVVIVDRGRTIADGTADELKAELAGDRIDLGLRDTSDAARANGVAARFASAPADPSPTPSGTADPTVRIPVPNADSALPEVLAAMEGAGVKVATARGVRPTLDDVFLALTGRSLTEEEPTE